MFPCMKISRSDANKSDNAIFQCAQDAAITVQCLTADDVLNYLNAILSGQCNQTADMKNGSSTVSHVSYHSAPLLINMSTCTKFVTRPTVSSRRGTLIPNFAHFPSRPTMWPEGAQNHNLSHSKRNPFLPTSSFPFRPFTLL